MAARAMIALMLACAGPRPTAEVADVSPSPEPGRERVTVAIDNRGRHGEVTVDVRITDGTAVIHAQRTVEMQAGERVSLPVDIPAPAAKYTASVDVKYPD